MKVDLVFHDHFIPTRHSHGICIATQMLLRALSPTDDVCMCFCTDTKTSIFSSRNKNSLRFSCRHVLPGLSKSQCARRGTCRLELAINQARQSATINHELSSARQRRILEMRCEMKKEIREGKWEGRRKE